MNWEQALIEFRKDFDVKCVEKTKGSVTHKGYDTTAIKLQYLIDRANQVVGIGKWGMTDHEFIIHETQNGRTFVEVSFNLWMTIEGETASFLTMGGHNSKIISDAKKGAITNALKYGFKFFSLGWQTYAGELDEDNEPQDSEPYNSTKAYKKKHQPKEPPPPEPTAFEKHLEHIKPLTQILGWSKQELGKFITQKFATRWDQINEDQCHELYKILKEKSDKVMAERQKETVKKYPLEIPEEAKTKMTQKKLSILEQTMEIFNNEKVSQKFIQQISEDEPEKWGDWTKSKWKEQLDKAKKDPEFLATFFYKR